MKSKIIDIYFFSGTGNTFLISKEIKRYFEENKFVVNMFRIEKSDPSQLDKSHTIGIAVPIVVATTYPFCWEFINNIPETDQETEIFLVTTRAEFSGGIITPAKKIIKQKGYHPLGAKEINMPSNIFGKNKNDEKKKSLGLIEARRFAHDLHYNVSSWSNLNIASKIVKKISLKKSFSWMRKHYKMCVNESKCIRCGLCFRLCPIDNIEMINYPEIGNACQFCMRCFQFCPTDAIEIKNMRIKKYTAVEAEELLK